MRKFTGYEKGINLGGWLSQCDHSKERYETFIVEQDLENISKWGMDHIVYQLIMNYCRKTTEI